MDMAKKERLSPGQLAVLDQFSRIARITKEIPHYWDPKPIMNDQIDRLEARGFIERDDGSQSRHMGFYKITEKGASRIEMEVCQSCGGATHPDESACVHCGKLKQWADQETPSQA